MSVPTDPTDHAISDLHHYCQLTGQNVQVDRRANYEIGLVELEAWFELDPQP